MVALVFILLSGAFQLTRSISDDRDSQKSAILTTQGFLRRLLSEVRPIKVLVSKSEARLYFFGREDSIRFIGPISEHATVGGYYQIVVGSEHSGDRLEVAWDLFRGVTASPNEYAHQKTLLSGVESIHFDYFGSHGVDLNGRPEPAQWHNDWQDPRSLPDLIRMKVTFKTKNLLWPDLLVAPKVQALDVITNSTFSATD